MSRLACLLTIAALALLPAVASADPSPSNSVVPTRLRLLTAQPYGYDAGDLFTVVVRDEAGQPIPDIPVYLDFSACRHVMFTAEQPMAFHIAVDCLAETLAVITDEAGSATFAVYGSVVQRAPAVSDAGCVAVLAGRPPVLLGTASAVAYDADGVNGLTANDLSLVLCDYFSAIPYARSDFDGVSGIGLSDISLWLTKYVAAKGNARSGERCDGYAATTPQIEVPGTPLRLRWGACAAEGGLQTKTFACNTNTGSEQVVASFVAPPNVQSFSGFDAQVWVIAPFGSPISNWWRLGSGGCRSTAFSVSAGAASCLPIESPSGNWTLFAQPEYPGTIGMFDNVAVIRVTGAISDAATPLEEGGEYALFTLNLTHARTTGSGSCVGCANPATLMLDWVRLRQTGVANVGCTLPVPAAPLPDFLLRQGTDAFAYWQSAVGPIPIDAPAPGPRLALRMESPMRGGGRVTLSLPAAAHCRLTVYDLAGRVRRTLVDGALPAGERTLAWDGRDDAGQPLASGCYFAKLRAGEEGVARTIVLTR